MYQSSLLGSVNEMIQPLVWLMHQQLDSKEELTHLYD